MPALLKRNSVRVVIGLATLIIIVGLIGGAYYLFGLGGGSKSTNPAAAPSLAVSQNGVIFTIDASVSQASFTMSERLFGQPNTVVGTTHAITGQIMVDRQDPAQSQVGQLRIDLSTLVTDNDLRNRTLRNRILETTDPANQYAAFMPRSLSGLPSTTTGLEIGQTVSFQITGDLRIHQVTRSETFTVHVTIVSNTEIKGDARATVKYADFNLKLPNIPTVTDVSDDVLLDLAFTAHT